MNRFSKISGRTLLHHPVEHPDRKARPGAALAADGDIAVLSSEDRFDQRQPDADAALAGVFPAIEAVEDVGYIPARDPLAVVADKDLSQAARAAFSFI
jgi:hypothetical protein